MEVICDILEVKNVTSYRRASPAGMRAYFRISRITPAPLKLHS